MQYFWQERERCGRILVDIYYWYMTGKWPEMHNVNQDDLSKEVNEKFDFSWSDNKSPDISKEKSGYWLIKNELWAIKWSWDNKFSPEDIDQAFFQYAGKEIDKAGDSPQSKKLKELRTEMLIELQSVKDPREKLKKISKLKDVMVATIAKEKWWEMASAWNNTKKPEDKSILQDSFDKFKTLLNEISQEKQKNTERIARWFQEKWNETCWKTNESFWNWLKSTLDCTLDIYP